MFEMYVNFDPISTADHLLVLAIGNTTGSAFWINDAFFHHLQHQKVMYLQVLAV